MHLGGEKELRESVGEGVQKAKKENRSLRGAAFLNQTL